MLDSKSGLFISSSPWVKVGGRKTSLSVSLAGAHGLPYMAQPQPQAPPDWLMSQGSECTGYKERITVEKCWGSVLFKREKDFSLPQEPGEAGLVTWHLLVLLLFWLCTLVTGRSLDRLMSLLWFRVLPPLQETNKSVPVSVLGGPARLCQCLSSHPWARALALARPCPGPRDSALWLPAYFSSWRGRASQEAEGCLLAVSPDGAASAICFTCFTRPGTWLGGPEVLFSPCRCSSWGLSCWLI